jgi:serine/threonine-protein kinase Chk2
MVPTDSRGGDVLVLRSRSACPVPSMPKQNEKKAVSKDEYEKQEKWFEEKKVTGLSSSGYLFGRHPECGRHHQTASGVIVAMR